MIIRSWTCAVLIVCRCAQPRADVLLEEGDFALLEFTIFDCTSNEQHVGLDKFLRKLYGTRPSIDLDRSIARLRIPSPAAIDPAEIARGFERANTGLGRIMLTVKCTLLPGHVAIFPTGQRFVVRGVEAVAPVPRWRRVVFPGPRSRDQVAHVIVE